MSPSRTLRAIPLLCLALSGCAGQPPSPPELSRAEEGSHLRVEPEAAAATPPVVRDSPPVEPPSEEPPMERYTVVAKDLPVRELLFALARDAGMNLDLHPAITGTVTLSAVDQTLPQILNRVRRQVELRYEIEGRNLMVLPDLPFLRSYKVDYVNIARRSSGSVSVATQLATAGAPAIDDGKTRATGTNNSTTMLLQESANQFWETLVSNLRGLLGLSEKEGAGEILVNRESGIITIRASARQHEEIRQLLDQVMARAEQQVLIEATVVEVELSDRYQAGVDWSMVDAKNGLAVNQQLLGGSLALPPVTTLTINKPNANNLLATIKLLEQFGDLKVLSSPKVMALNNQTAMLKVVDNRVYFTVDVEITAGTAASPAVTTFESNVHTVPVGFVMAVTPQISESDQVTLNVRPTISRILGYVQDPNPDLARAGVVSQVPEIQVREIESVLKVVSGQIAVLGGLMQDSVQKNRAGVPGLAGSAYIGGLFSFRDETLRKTELVIFLRPTVIRNASVNADLRDFRRHLPEKEQAGD